MAGTTKKKTEVAEETDAPVAGDKLQLDIKTVQPYGPGFNYWEVDVTLTGITPLLMPMPGEEAYATFITENGAVITGYGYNPNHVAELPVETAA